MHKSQQVVTIVLYTGCPQPVARISRALVDDKSLTAANMISEQTPEDLWDPCLKRLSADYGERDISAWLRPLRILRSGNHVTLLAPNRVVLERVRNTYADALQRTLSGVAGYDLTLSIVVDNAPAPNESAFTLQPSNGASERFASQVREKLNPSYTLETFVEGKSNSQARAAGLLVSNSPGVAYNPLLIYGESGLGKTHLMHGIGNALLTRSDHLRVIYVKAEQWFNQMVSAIRYGHQDEFKNLYRTVDVLLIDDIHFLAGKEHSQEEFFHTFNALADSQKQIVLTCDRYPRELDQLDDRLKSRFTWGLSVPIEPPDFEMRVAILLNKAEQLGIQLPEDVAILVAQRIRTNVRELEGALHRLNASTQFTGNPITVDFARACLRDMLASYDRQVSLEAIKRCVAGHFKIRINDLNSTRRTRSLARPRQIAMALAKELTQHSYPEIGNAFGKDHTTVLHACRKIAELRRIDERLNDDYEFLLRTLTN